ncbi:MAG TPA: thioredoxin family protein [Streptosporangiaceae bacterium]|nr:thioredoxin family protein [Streptosporangiaceae bacterium]
MTAGTVAVVVALAVAVIAGGLWRRTNGRMRNTVAAGGSAGPVMMAASAEAATPAEALVLPAAPASVGPAGAGRKLSGDDIGHLLGERATLLQFSTAFCAPCRATRRILADVAGLTAGVAHVEIDAESRLDLVRQLNVLRTPTVLVLAGDGTIVRRASGQPRKPDVIAAIGVAVDYNSYIYNRDSRE